MNNFTSSEMRLIISNSAKNNMNLPYLKPIKQSQKILSHRINLIRTLKIYIKKYCQFSPNRDNILYLSILYLDIILSKNKISLQYDKNLKYLCLCCFLLSLKFIGNYDLSKRIIKNFCNNYKDEYKIFEIQCLILLEHNLIYSTVYDYINMILAKESKKLISISSSLLYQLCEDNLFISYSPFYISVAIVLLAKNSINDKRHNHYDKYFHDQRVKYLYKMFSYVINPPQIKFPLKIESTNDNTKNNNSEINSNFNNNTKYNKNKYDNYASENYKHNRGGGLKSSSINIFTNNNIQNNIVIINEFPRRKDEDNNKSRYNNNSIANDIEIKEGRCYTTKNKTPLKIFVNRNSKNKVHFNDFNQNKLSENELGIKYIKEYTTNNDDNNNKNYLRKVNTVLKNNTLLKSYFNPEEMKDNYKQNTYKIPRFKQYKNMDKSQRISYCSYSSNNLPKFISNKTINRSCHRINKNFDEADIKDGNKSNDIFIQNQNQTKSSSSMKRRIIYMNKSSLNFELVSGVPKEKLEKLSRNLSKTLMKTNDKSSKFLKFK